MSGIACPHCGAMNKDTAAFCASCGKAVQAGSGGPKVIKGSDIASTGAGRQLQGDELAKTARKAVVALSVIAVFQFLGAVYFLLMSSDSRYDSSKATMVAAVVAGIGLLFVGLALWAKRAPLPAAIVGLVIIGTLWLVDVIAAPENMARGIVIKLVIVIMLAQAIQAGIQHRRLKAQEGAAG